MGTATFKQLEHAGWAQKADAYDDWLAPVTRRAIGPMLASLCDTYEGKRFLDISTGTGHLAAAAADRGSIAEGLDFAEPMVAKARENYPGLAFTVGDAEHLPYVAASFEVAACAFGLLHFADADAAISEVHRVLNRAAATRSACGVARRREGHFSSWSWARSKNTERWKWTYRQRRRSFDLPTQRKAVGHSWVPGSPTS